MSREREAEAENSAWVGKLNARRVRMTAIAAVTSLGFVTASCSSDHHILNGAGKGSAPIASLGWFMIILSSIIGVAFLSLFAWALFRGGRREPWKREKAVVVAGGIFLPLAVIATLTFMTLTTLKGRDEPADIKIEVIGHQFWWEVRYPDSGFTTANEIRIPVGQPVDLVLTTKDVIHSLWVPDLDGKMDMIPGRTNHLIVTANHAGRYRGQCAEFCGIQHAHMAFVVDAVSPDDYQEWLKEQSAEAVQPANDIQSSGKRAFKELPCASCHTIRGTGASGTKGPDLTHFASRDSIGADAVPNDRGHLGGWIANSQTIKPGNLMPAIPLSPDELQGLLAYLESLR